MIWRSTTAYFNKGSEDSEIARVLIDSESTKSYFKQNDEDGEVGVENHSNILFYEINYLTEIYNKRYFSDIVDKFYKKITESNIKFWDEKKYKLESKQVKFDEIENSIYSKIILSNNITNSNNKDEISKITPTIFEMLNQVYVPDLESEKIVNYYKAIFSLIFLCESTVIKNNEFTFEFSKKEQTQFKITQDTIFDENIYFSIYKWVIEKCDKIVKVENLLKIVRELLSRKKFEDISIEVIEQLETAYNQAVSADIDKYFLSQEKLKDEFTSLTKLEFVDKRKLQYEILGLLVAISSSIYAIISKIKDIDFILKKSFENKSFFNNFYVPFTIKILLFSSLISIVYFAFIFYNDIKMRKQLYEKIKNIYIEKLNFSDKEIIYYIDEPKVFAGNAFEWIILGLFSSILIFFILY